MLNRNEVKYIQSLYHKKKRNEEGAFIAEGTKLMSELLNSSFRVIKIYALKNWIMENANVENVVEVTESELKKISRQETPNNVLAIVEKNDDDDIPDLRNKVTVILDGIQDPGNLGTIIRTADWFGVENIIATNDTADVYNPKVIQSSMGSFLRVNMFYTDISALLSATKIPVFGATLKGNDISTIGSVAECLLVIGNESKGIRQEILPWIQHQVTIPGIGKAESLNAAVATGIILWKLRVQHSGSSHLP